MNHNMRRNHNRIITPGQKNIIKPGQEPPPPPQIQQQMLLGVNNLLADYLQGLQLPVALLPLIGNISKMGTQIAVNLAMNDVKLDIQHAAEIDKGANGPKEPEELPEGEDSEPEPTAPATCRWCGCPAFTAEAMELHVRTCQVRIEKQARAGKPEADEQGEAVGDE